VSQIFEALTIAQDRAVERLVERKPENDDPISPPPKRLVLSHKKIRYYLILAFFVVGLALLATNYAFDANGGLAKSQPVYSVAFQSVVHPASEFSITADLTGTVSDISVKVGDTVQKGQALLLLDARDAELNLQQAGVELQAAQANLNDFRARLAEANARVETAQREERQVPTRQWRDSPERAAAAYDLALNNFNRAKALYDAGVTPKQELEARQTELRIAQDDLENAKKLAGVSSRLESDQTIQANLESVVKREELQEQLRQAQLKYQRAREQAEAKIVRATKPGVLSDIPVHIGDHVSTGVILARLAELDHLIAEVPVASRMIAQLKVGQAADIRLPTSPPLQVKGEIRLINPLPSQNMTHIVEVKFDNPTLLLLAGQAAEVRFSKP
jgi:HlyD family secretion protein